MTKIKPPRASMMGELEWKQVQSSNIDKLAWHATNRYPATPYEDLRTGWLFVRFHSERIYAYREVPEQVFHAITAADSVGSMFNKLVRGAGAYVHLTDAGERG